MDVFVNNRNTTVSYYDSNKIAISKKLLFLSSVTVVCVLQLYKCVPVLCHMKQQRTEDEE